MKHKPMRRILAGLLAGMLCLSMTPSAAFAEEAPRRRSAGPGSADRSGHTGNSYTRNGAQP